MSWLHTPKFTAVGTYYFDDLLHVLLTASGRGSVDLSEPSLAHRLPQSPAVFACDVSQHLSRGERRGHLVRPALLGSGPRSRACSFALRLVPRVCSLFFSSSCGSAFWRHRHPLSWVRAAVSTSTIRARGIKLRMRKLQ